MHVREIPRILFNEFTDDPQTVDVASYVKTNFPLAYNDGLSNLRGRFRVSGETTEGLWLAIKDTDSTTLLGVYDTEWSAVLDANEIAAVIAGDRYNGKWADGLGDQREQNIWLRVYERSVRLENLEPAQKIFSLLGKVAVRLGEIYEEGSIESSVFFDNEVAIEIVD